MQHLKLQFLAAALDHDDAMPLTVLFSMLALSLIERTPESIGEDTVQSTREEGVASVEPESVTDVGAESKTREAAESGTMSVTVRGVDSGAEGSAMSVTGRMVGGGGVLLTVCTTGGLGESLMGGVDVHSSTISNWMGMSECGVMEGGGSVGMSQSVTGTGEGAGDGGRLSCTDGVGESAKVAWVSSSNAGSGSVTITSTSLHGGFGDSNVELGGGSMMGVVQINKEAGAV